MHECTFTKRVRIPTGLYCNEKCKFCYYYFKLNTQTYSTEEISHKLENARKFGIEDIDFSGGEPTLRKDLPKLVAYAKELGFRKICIITNGTRTQDIRYFKSLLSAGLNEVLLSLHGDASTHDESVQRKGAFQDVMRTIQNIHKTNTRLRINTVISNLNYKKLDRLVKFIEYAHPVAQNFIFFNDWVTAAKLAKALGPKYSEAAPFVQEAVDFLSSSISKISVRYIPFCFMLGYEKHVCNILQNEFDPDEWVDPVKTVLIYSSIESVEAKRYYESLFEKYKKHPEESLLGVKESIINEFLGELNSKIFYYLPKKYLQIAHKAENAHRRSTYKKPDLCCRCRFFFICDGLEKSYYELKGGNELSPLEGETIKDPMHFRAKYSIQWQ